MDSVDSGLDEEYMHFTEKQDIGFIDIQKDKSIIDYKPSEESDVVSISIPFPWVNGKPPSGFVGETIVDSVTIKNMTSEAVDIWSISIYDSKPAGAFTLSIMKPPTADSDEEYIKDFRESTYLEDRVLTTDRDQIVWVSCKPKEIGLYSAAVHFSVDNEKIERLVFVLAEDKVSKSLSSSARPYQRIERKMKQDVVNIHSTDAAYVVGRRPAGGSSHRFKHRLPKYPVPSDIRDMVNDKKIPQVVRQGLSESNYTSFFSTLLAMEEIKLETDMRVYDMEGVALRRRGNQYLTLEVPGLAERRPSLVSGDYIFVKLASEDETENKAYQGYIHRVESEEIYLKFDRKFHCVSGKGNLYNVQFTYNRTNMQRLYQAVEAAADLERNFLFPSSWSKMRTGRVWQLVPISHSLNEEQRRCVETILTCKGGCPYLIHGPPGTGKTTCLVETILQIYEKRKHARMLVCAPSNSAADHILERLVYQDSVRILDWEIFRLNAYTRAFDDVRPDLIDFCCVEDFFFKCPSRRDLMQCRIVISTYTSASLLSMEGIPSGHFSYIFLDEAGQASEPETMVPLSHFYSSKAVVVLAGDPKQLGPVVFSRTVERCGLGTSYMERLFECGLYGRGDVNYMVKLVRNYRTHEAILRLPSEMFYDGELIPCKGEGTSSVESWESLLPNKDFPLLFIGIQGCDEREGNNPSWFNRIEASKVVDVVRILTEGGLKEEDIGVITPYRQQVCKIRGALEMLRTGNIKVGSVEQFQGQEREVIIISTVRSTVKHNEFDRVHYLGFLSNPRRFNVSVTRARSLLVVIGNPHILCQDPNWNKLLWYCVENGSYKGCFLPEQEAVSVEQPDGTNEGWGDRGTKWQPSEGQWEEGAGNWNGEEGNQLQPSEGQWEEGAGSWDDEEGNKLQPSEGQWEEGAGSWDGEEGNQLQPSEGAGNWGGEECEGAGKWDELSEALLAVEVEKQKQASGDQGDDWKQSEEACVVKAEETLKLDKRAVHGDDNNWKPTEEQWGVNEWKQDDWGVHGDSKSEKPRGVKQGEEWEKAPGNQCDVLVDNGWKQSETPRVVDRAAEWQASGDQQGVHRAGEASSNSNSNNSRPRRRGSSSRRGR